MCITVHQDRSGAIEWLLEKLCDPHSGLCKSLSPPQQMQALSTLWRVCIFTLGYTRETRVHGLYLLMQRVLCFDHPEAAYSQAQSDGKARLGMDASEWVLPAASRELCVSIVKFMLAQWAYGGTTSVSVAQGHTCIHVSVTGRDACACCILSLLLPRYCLLTKVGAVLLTW